MMTFTRNSLFVLSLAATSSVVAQPPTVELIWTSTTGEGTTGTNTITAGVGDYLTLDVIVTGGSDPLGAVSISLYWDAADLSAYNAIECPNPPNPSGPEICTDSNLNEYEPFNPGVPIEPGSAEGFDVLSIGGYPNGEEMYLGRVEFYVEPGAETENVVVGYRPETDYVATYDIWYPEATATLVPPCSGCDCPP